MAKPNPPVMLITGCSTGIGRHCAFALQKRGWRVFATARNPADVEALVRDGLNDALVMDVNDDASIQRAVGTLLERTRGRIDALFNNAGFGQPGALEDLPREALREQFETNVFGVHAMTRAVLPAMRAQGWGRIVQHSSVLGFIALPWRGAYNASKYALEGLTDTLRQELRGTGIEAILIQTGPVTSRFRANGWERFKRWVGVGGPATATGIQASANLEHANTDWRERVAASVHRDTYQAVIDRLEGDGEPPFTLGPEAVARKLILAVESMDPKPRYHVTVPTHVFKALKRCLPTRALDTVIRWVNG
ncbi:SDR family NAD(P)-dependent oxidoreductase [Spiribacter insolitus]|uniref:SDR family NAD(P)-dependent oxidoreductase n=1 Tax=Spiribacter insolitus TaxID=3122417 RepID=A0ABV3T9Y7_9GAMM